MPTGPTAEGPLNWGLVLPIIMPVMAFFVRMMTSYAPCTPRGIASHGGNDRLSVPQVDHVYLDADGAILDKCVTTQVEVVPSRVGERYFGTGVTYGGRDLQYVAKLNVWVDFSLHPQAKSHQCDQ